MERLGLKMNKPLLHLVFGGEVEDPQTMDFYDTEGLDIVGIYPDHSSALNAWRAASQGHVDNAHMKYVIVHLHRILDPSIET